MPQWELPETQVYILLDSHSYTFSLGMHSCSYSPSVSLKKKKKKKRKKEGKKGVPIMAQGPLNNIQEETGLSLELVQWVKDPALP